MRGSIRRVVGNTQFQSIPMPKSIAHTISDATVYSFCQRVAKPSTYHRYNISNSSNEKRTTTLEDSV
jgi:hypothetical protein